MSPCIWLVQIVMAGNGIVEIGEYLSSNDTITGWFSRVLQILAIIIMHKIIDKVNEQIHQILKNWTKYLSVLKLNIFLLYLHVYRSIQWWFGSKKYRMPCTVVFEQNSLTISLVWKKLISLISDLKCTEEFQMFKNYLPHLAFRLCFLLEFPSKLHLNRLECGRFLFV